MTNPKLTEIVFLIDRSGSMGTIKDDMIGGMKSFVDEQKKNPDPCVVSVYQFDDKYDILFEERPLEEVELELEPRGLTALTDALGKSINDVGTRLSKKSEEERPGKIVFVVVTDGHENASREYQQKHVKDMVKEQQEKYNWQFAFLGANIDSFSVGGGYGVAATSTMNYAASTAGVTRGYGTLSTAIANYRTGSADAKLKFDEEEDDNS